MDSPLFSPCFFGKSPCPAWTLPDRGFPCYRFPHAGDRASKSQVFLFFRIERRNQDDNFQQHSSTQHNTEAIGCEPHPDGCRPNHLSFPLIPNFVDFTLLSCGDCLVSVAGVEPARISIHSPHTRGDMRRSLPVFRAYYFNPLPSYEGRLGMGVSSPDVFRFQSTLLIRGETDAQAIFIAQAKISIHSPYARGDRARESPSGSVNISIHSPHTREDAGVARYHRPPSNFNPLPLIRGETGYRWQALNANVFQSTPLMRGET